MKVSQLILASSLVLATLPAFGMNKTAAPTQPGSRVVRVQKSIEKKAPKHSHRRLEMKRRVAKKSISALAPKAAKKSKISKLN